MCSSCGNVFNRNKSAAASICAGVCVLDRRVNVIDSVAAAVQGAPPLLETTYLQEGEIYVSGWIYELM